MADEKTEAGQVTASQEVGPTGQTGVCSMEKKSWFKGPLGMAICCGGPLLLVAAITFFGVSLGAMASGALSHDANDDEQEVG
jgi:hypothetical protein